MTYRVQHNGEKRLLRGRRGVLALAGLLSVLLGASLPLGGQPNAPRHLLIEPALEAKLRLLAAGLHTEIVLCLWGAATGDTARAGRFSMPEPRFSSFQRSAFLPCPREALGVWHNHPLLESREQLPRALGTVRANPRVLRPVDLCALSRKDIQTAARLGHPFTMVAVDEDTWCWWTRTQVHRLARRRAAQGDPVVGQGSWSPSP